MTPSAEDYNDRLAERVARIEAIIPHLDTKTWVLGGVIGGMISGMAVASPMAVAIAKWWQ